MAISGIFVFLYCKPKRKKYRYANYRGQNYRNFLYGRRILQFFFDKMVKKYTINKPVKRRYHRDGKMTIAEIMTIMINHETQKLHER